MKKQLNEMVFPVANYTDKIHIALKMMFATRSWLSFTSVQMKVHLQAGYPWLKTLTPQQSILLDKLITTGIKKLIQMGLVKKVTSTVSVESQWQSARTVAQSGYFNATSVPRLMQLRKRLVVEPLVAGVLSV